MTVFGVILIILVILFVVFLTIGQIKIIYWRHFKSYNLEIEQHLQSQGLTLENIHLPNKNNWINSPFEKPKNLRISLLVAKINGVPVTWNDQKYKIIKTNEGEIIWLEIDTTYFKKPLLKFKLAKKIKQKKLEKKTQNVINKNVTETCPACGFYLIHDDNECADCGLNLN